MLILDVDAWTAAHLAVAVRAHRDRCRAAWQATRSSPSWSGSSSRVPGRDRTGRTSTSGVDAFWPLVSVAELALTRHLLDGEPGEPAVEEAYLRAALLGPTPDQARAVLDQLELYHRLGDAPALLERLEARFRPFLRSRC